MDDNQLLTQYCQDQNEAAFTELVSRHAAWVNAAARRQVADDHLAQDVTQAVFLLMARKASVLQNHQNLGAWLFVTTRFCARQALRQRARMRRREQEAATMRNEVAVEDAQWPQIAPELDAALARMNVKDRDAILLRYYRQLSLSEVGRALGINEDAARKRVSRAVEKLRNKLVARGVTVGVAAFGIALTEHVTQRVSAEVVAAYAQSALSGGTAATSLLATNTLKMAIIAKLKITWGIAAVLLVVAGALVAVISAGGGKAKTEQNVGVKENLAAMAQAQQDYATPIIPPIKDFIARGVVSDMNGKPIAGARVWVSKSLYTPELNNVGETRTDNDGRFTLAGIPMPRANWLTGSVIIDAPGYALAGLPISRRQIFTDDFPQEFKLGVPLTIEGIVTDEAGKPVAGASVGCNLQSGWLLGYGYVNMNDLNGYGAKTDDQGRFVLQRLPADSRAEIQVMAEGYASYDSRFTKPDGRYPFGAGARNVRIMLKPGGKCEVTVEWPKDQVRKRLRIAATPENGERPSYGMCEMDGKVTIKGLLPGVYSLRVENDRWVPVAGVNIQAGKTSEAIIKPIVVHGITRPVRGHIMDDKTGKALMQKIYAVAPGTITHGDSEIESDAKGLFIADLLPGDYDLVTIGWEAGNYRDQRMTIRVPEKGDIAPIEWRIPARKKIRGILVDESGKPQAGSVAGWEIEYVGSDGRFEIDEPNALRNDGIIQMYAVNDAKTLGLSWSYDSNKPQAFYRLVLQPFIQIKGRVVDAAGNAVPLTPDDLTVNNKNMGQKAAYYAATLNAESFEIPRLVVGAGEELLITRNGMQRRIDIRSMRAGEVRDLGNINIAQEAATRRVIGAPYTAVISGKIVDMNGKPVPGLRMGCQESRERGTLENVSDFEGKFTVRGLPEKMLIRLAFYSEIYGDDYKVVRAGTTDLLWQVKPIAYDLIGKPAPALHLAEWLRGQPFELNDLRGQVVMLMIGGRLGPKRVGQKQDEFAIVAKTYADKGLVAAMILDPLPEEGNDEQLDALETQSFIDDQKWAFAVGVDTAAPPKPRKPRPVLKKGDPLPNPYVEERNPSLTCEAYDQRLSWHTVYLIDRKGILRSVVPVNEIDASVRKLLAEE